ncbi:MAG TPA: NUDIX hydrolase [Burkholderiales bacterium]|nr:NUDIX hydrolase [Burkholderiales bacterium]
MSKSLMPQSDFTEATVATESVYDGAMLKVRDDQVRLPDGKLAKREWIEHPGAVIILAQLDDGQVVLERQFRYPVRRHMIELPAGKIEPGEDPLLTAQRELLEETGYVARHWKHFMAVHPCIGYSNERIEFYQASGLTLQRRQLDDGEFLDVFTLSLAEALTMVDSGEITDTKTMLGLFWLDRQSRR